MVMVARLPYLLLMAVLAVAFVNAAPSWPTPYAYTPDNMPVIQVRLAPPSNPLPEVAEFLSKLDSDRKDLETAGMQEVEDAYKASLEVAEQKLTASIDHLMHAFEKPFVLSRFGYTANRSNAASFTQARAALEGHEMTARINLFPVATPDSSLELLIQEIEDKRTRDERNIFKQAVAEMAGLTHIVQNELQAQISQKASSFFQALHPHSTPISSTSGISAGFFSAHQPVSASGPHFTTNVRVSASDEPFPTITAMVEKLESDRDLSEDAVKTKLLERELKLLQTENNLIAEKLGSWVKHLLQTSA